MSFCSWLDDGGWWCHSFPVRGTQRELWFHFRSGAPPIQGSVFSPSELMRRRPWPDTSRAWGRGEAKYGHCHACPPPRCGLG